MGKKIQGLENQIKRLKKQNQAARAGLKTAQAELQKSSDRLRKTMDGSGYPRGLAGDDILPEARILAVADVVEAMSSHRPYRPALGPERAIDEISQQRGILYDAEAVDACLKAIDENEALIIQSSSKEN